MLVPNQIVEVKVIGPTLQHYRNLGYDVNYLDVIKVPVEHLTKGSKVVVQVKCDVCGKEFPRPYKKYLHYHSQGIDTCNEHKNIKTKVTCMEKYGVENIFQYDEFKEKHRQTCLGRYGHEYISQVPEIRQKIEDTCYERYGGPNPMYSDEVKEKIAKTNLDKYGVPYAILNPDIREKAMQSYYNNGTVKTSKEQTALHKIVVEKYPSAELNKPFDSCLLDIYLCVDGIEIDIEYDGWYWHQDALRDMRRDKHLQSKGIKVLRVRSGSLLPTEKELFTAIDELITTNRNFKEIVLSDWEEHNNNEEEVSA